MEPKNSMRNKKIPCHHWIKRLKIHPGGGEHFPLLWPHSWLHDACGTQIICYPTSESNQEYNEKGRTIFGLCSNSPQFNHHLSSKQHGFSIPQQRIIPLRNQRMKPSRRVFLHVQQSSVFPQQWSHTHNCLNYQGGHVFGCGGRHRSTLHQFTRSHLHSPHAWGNGTPIPINS